MQFQGLGCDKKGVNLCARLSFRYITNMKGDPKLRNLLLTRAALALFTGIVLSTGCGHPGPERVVREAISAFNAHDYRRLVRTLDPSVESLVGELSNKTNDSDVESIRSITRMLPGLNLLAGSPFPDEVRLDHPRFSKAHIEDDFAWIDVNMDVLTRARSKKDHYPVKAHFSLHRTEREGWRIVDLSR